MRQSLLMRSFVTLLLIKMLHAGSETLDGEQNLGEVNIHDNSFISPPSQEQSDSKQPIQDKQDVTVPGNTGQTNYSNERDNSSRDFNSTSKTGKTENAQYTKTTGISQNDSFISPHQQPANTEQLTEIDSGNAGLTNDSNEGAYSSRNFNSTPEPELNGFSLLNMTYSEVNSITVVFIGRSGSGVSSSIRTLIGDETTCGQPDGKDKFQGLMEYTISNISSPEGSLNQIKLVDVPGLVDGRTLKQDAEILASLKSYMISEGLPDLFVAVSRFDDNRMAGEHSLFGQLLRRVELIQKIFHGNRNRTNTAFLLTNYMSSTRAMQRDPRRKIRDFADVITNYTSFSPPIEIQVGDNHARSEHEVDVEEGYYKLPNGQIYPKNVWQGLLKILEIESATKNLDTEKDLITTIMNNREMNMSCQTRLVSPQDEMQYEEDVEALTYLLQRNKPVSIEFTDVNLLINEKFYKYDVAQQLSSIVQKVALQVSLQDGNITELKDLPTRSIEKARFFQKNKISTGGAILLDEAFGLKMPAYTRPLTVGYGYDLVKDEIISNTPFRLDSVGPSEVGFKLPTFIKCRPLSDTVTVDLSSYSVDHAGYFHERMKHLDIRGIKNISGSLFAGNLKEGYNLPPLEGDTMPSLSTVREERTVKCMLKRDSLVPSAEFITAVEGLEPLVECKRDSVNEWNNFFETFGTHLITLAHGGGSINGRLVGPRVREIVSSEYTRIDTMEALLNIEEKLPLDGLDPPTYTIFGGDYDSQEVRLWTMGEEDRYDLLEKWKESLSGRFVIFNNEMNLESIDHFVRPVNSNKSVLVGHALSRLFQGKLVFKRCTNVQQSQTSRPSRPPNPVSQGGIVTFSSTESSTSPRSRVPSHEVAPQQVSIDEVSEIIRKQKLKSNADHEAFMEEMRARREETARKSQELSNALLRRLEESRQIRLGSYNRTKAEFEINYQKELTRLEQIRERIKNETIAAEEELAENSESNIFKGRKILGELAAVACGEKMKAAGSSMTDGWFKVESCIRDTFMKEFPKCNKSMSSYCKTVWFPSIHLLRTNYNSSPN